MERLIIENKVFEKISNHSRGKIFFSENFSNIGSLDSINRALARLEKKEILVRLAQGIYLYPKKDKDLGILYPSIEEIAKAIAKRDKARIIPTGVQALNKLGLSTQVPLKAVYLTDGAPRSIRVGKRTIVFKKTTPKNLSAKGEISKLVIQALRQIGKENVTNEQLAKIFSILQKEKPENITHDARVATVWISKILMLALNNPDKG